MAPSWVTSPFMLAVLGMSRRRKGSTIRGFGMWSSVHFLHWSFQLPVVWDLLPLLHINGLLCWSQPNWINLIVLLWITSDVNSPSHFFVLPFPVWEVPEPYHSAPTIRLTLTLPLLRDRSMTTRLHLYCTVYYMEIFLIMLREGTLDTYLMWRVHD